MRETVVVLEEQQTLGESVFAMVLKLERERKISALINGDYEEIGGQL